ncbi:MAG: hypothetical protein C0505_00305 [Leptothrix sp. (in: Bacteria)]|nr:hypothetical protein [Leptothrix sp. (in: b-proteobacteria)]
MSLFRRFVATTLSASLVFSGMAVAAPSALIGTEQVAASLAPATNPGSREQLLATLDRADLAAALEARGVAVAEVRARVDALSDAEAAQLLTQIDQAPAGADIVGTLFTVFLILLVTDILGLTKVFPFTRAVR